MFSKVIVIGGGFAGLKVAKALDALLISKSDEFVYLPRLPELLREKHKQVHLPLTECHKNTIIDEITELDLSNNLIRSQDKEYTYDYLVIATGATTPAPVPGSEKYTQTFNTLQDAEQLKGTTNKNIIIVGAGPTGVEVAAELAHNNNVTILQRGDNILLQYNQKTQRYAEVQLAKLGVHLTLNSNVSEVRIDRVITDEEEIPFDICIWTAGVAANIPEGAPKKRGIPVNEHLQVTGYENVFAIGDCSESGNPLTAQAAEYEAKLAITNIKRHQKHKPLIETNFHSKGSFLLLADNAVMQTKINITGKFATFIRNTYYSIDLRKYKL